MKALRFMISVAAVCLAAAVPAVSVAADQVPIPIPTAACTTVPSPIAAAIKDDLASGEVVLAMKMVYVRELAVGPTWAVSARLRTSVGATTYRTWNLVFPPGAPGRYTLTDTSSTTAALHCVRTTRAPSVPAANTALAPTPTPVMACTSLPIPVAAAVRKDLANDETLQTLKMVYIREYAGQHMWVVSARVLTPRGVRYRAWAVLYSPGALANRFGFSPTTSSVALHCVRR